MRQYFASVSLVAGRMRRWGTGSQPLSPRSVADSPPMHEVSIVEALVEQVQAQAASRNAKAVHSVSVRVGELSGVVPELLGTAFEFVRENTLCEGARLEIEFVPARWQCPECHAEPSRGGPLACAGCGAPLRLVAGGELTLMRLELEVPDV